MHGQLQFNNYIWYIQLSIEISQNICEIFKILWNVKLFNNIFKSPQMKLMKGSTFSHKMRMSLNSNFQKIYMLRKNISFLGILNVNDI